MKIPFAGGSSKLYNSDLINHRFIDFFEKLFISEILMCEENRLSNCCTHLAFASSACFILTSSITRFFLFSQLLSSSSLSLKQMNIFFAFKWTKIVFFVLPDFLFCDFCLLNDHQSACVHFHRENTYFFLAISLGYEEETLVINWCDLRTFRSDPKFLELIDFDFIVNWMNQPEKPFT